MTFPFPVIPPRAAAVSVGTFVNREDTSNGTVYTFTGVTMASAGLLLIGVSGVTSGGTGLSGVTVNGVAATELFDQAGTGGNLTVGLYQISLAAGASGDVVVTFSNTQSAAGVGLLPVYGANATANDTDVSTATPGTDSLNCPANGIIVGYGATYRSGADAASISWTNLTERFGSGGVVLEAGSRVRHTGAYDLFSAAQSGLSITMTPSDGTETVMLLASYGPA